MSDDDTIDAIGTTNPKSLKNALGIEGLDLGPIVKQLCEGAAVSTSYKNHLNSIAIHLDWPDGRGIWLAREKYKGRIIIEAKDRHTYEKKEQGKLRRSFVQPADDFLEREIKRQLGLFLDLYGKLWTASEAGKKVKAEARKRREAAAEGLAKILRGTRNAAIVTAVEGPDPEANDWGCARVSFLLGADAEHDVEVSDATWSVREDGRVCLEFDPVSPAVAATIAEALAPFVARRIDCGHVEKFGKKRTPCDQGNLEKADEREQARCWTHKKHEGSDEE